MTQPCLQATLGEQLFENIVETGDDAGKQYFLLLPTMFSTLSKKEITTLSKFNLLYANSLNLVQPKHLLFCKELRQPLDALNILLQEPLSC